jgi:hypothetical protein
MDRRSFILLLGRSLCAAALPRGQHSVSLYFAPTRLCRDKPHTTIAKLQQSQATLMMIPSTLPHKWLMECRDPVLLRSFGEKSYAFLLFSLPTWIELLIYTATHMLVAAIFSVCIYYTIIRKSHGSTLPFLLTFGVYLPFWILVPKSVLDMLGFQNKLYRFTLLVITPTLSTFRTMEAFFGFTPLYAQRSVADFALYFGSALFLRFDTHTQSYVKTNLKVVFGHLFRFIFLLFTTGMFQSMFHIFPHFPKLGGPANEDYYSLRNIVDPGQWRDTALYAILLQQYLTAFGEGLMFATNVLTGKQTHPLMKNPMFESLSPSDFWGRRWNLLIHQSLKGAVYKPVLQAGGSRFVAVLAAFLASALFHEWVLISTFNDYPNKTGANTVFFAWQGILVALEFLVARWPFVTKYLSKTLPRPLRSLLVVLCGIPFGHWFLDSYINSNFFEQGHMVMFSVLPVEQQ